jgi:CDP-diacylglycerol--glycerol-3-phosphate 3-phosphatidyltransferase
MRSPTLLGAGLLLHFVGDVLDGQLARRLGLETRSGAVLDILSDRLAVSLFYAGYLGLHPGWALPISLFLLQFLVVDQYLSLAFLLFPPLTSPNYFHLIDRPIYRANWTWWSKAANTGTVTVLLAVLRAPGPATAAAVALVGIKAWSLWRLHTRTPIGLNRVWCGAWPGSAAASPYPAPRRPSCRR